MFGIQRCIAFSRPFLVLSTSKAFLGTRSIITNESPFSAANMPSSRTLVRGGRKVAFPKENSIISFLPFYSGALNKKTMKFNRTGTVVVHIEPRNTDPEAKSKYDFSKKKIFRMTPNFLGKLLALGRSDYLSSLINTKEINEEFSLKSNPDHVFRISIKLLPTTNVEFTMTETKGKAEPLVLSAQLEFSELVLIQNLIQQSLPDIYGWNKHEGKQEVNMALSENFQDDLDI